MSESFKDDENFSNNTSSGISIESASYIENNNLVEDETDTEVSENPGNEFTPKLFSEEQIDKDIDVSNDQTSINSEELFDQDLDKEEDFEIPAFLRKQKF